MATGEATAARETVTADAIVIRLSHDLEEMRAQIKDNLDRTLIHVLHFFVVVLAKEIGRHDRGNVPRIHLVATLFIDSVERRDPVKEAE